MAATDAQVQKFVNERIRPHAELVRQLLLVLDDDISAIDDVYEAVNTEKTTWKDDRTDGPPCLLAPKDVLAINAFLHDVRDAIKNHAQYPIVLKACVRGVLGG